MSIGMAGLMLLAASTVYVLPTPWKALGGVIGGLAMPIASTLASYISLLEFVLWGAIALLMQLITYRMVDLVLQGIPRRISKDEVGAAVVLAAAKLGTGLIFAAGLWDPVLQRV